MTIHCVHCPDYDPDNMYDQVKLTNEGHGCSESEALTKPKELLFVSSLPRLQTAWQDQPRVAVLLALCRSPGDSLTWRRGR